MKQIDKKQIHKLYASNFLTGLVFWYGIEKLFMQTIHISAYQIGVLTAIFIVVSMLLDIPGGLLADSWSRKYTLVLSSIFLGASSLVLGLSSGFLVYTLGYILYALYVVTTDGVYQAIMYDSLHELNLQKHYSKLNGRAHALFLVGAGVANIASGFIAQHLNFRATFILTLIPCAVNIVLMCTLAEPRYHKPQGDKRPLQHLVLASRAILLQKLLQVLAIVLALLTVIEYFKSDFGQLYMLHYISSAQALGFLWAAYAFTWALGSFIAHRLHNHLHLLIAFSTLPILLMAVVDNWVSLVLFNVQAVAAAALFNQIETRVQDASPSHIRASVMSALSTMGRVVSVPAAVLIGWLFHRGGAMLAVRGVSVIAVVILLYWPFYVLSAHRKTNKAPEVMG